MTSPAAAPAGRRLRVALVLLCVASACDDAAVTNVFDTGRPDARTGSDAGPDASSLDGVLDAGVEPRPDAGSHDVGPMDAGAEDVGLRDAGDASPDGAGDAGDAGSGGDVVFADDFDDATFDDDWMVRNGSFVQRDGTLVAGPSCMWTGHCPEGPALIATHALFELGDGRMTLEYDVSTGPGNAQYVNRALVDMHAEVEGRRIVALDTGATADLDPILRAFWHIGGAEDFRSFSVCARCLRSDPVELATSIGGEDDTWYHVTARFCGSAGLGLNVVARDDGVELVDDARPASATPPADVREVYLLVWLEGGGKRIDNLVLRRGCD